MIREPDPRFPGPYGKTLPTARGRFAGALLRLLLPPPTLLVLGGYALTLAVTQTEAWSIAAARGVLSRLIPAWGAAELLYAACFLFWTAAGLIPRAKNAAAVLSFGLLTFVLFHGLPFFFWRFAPAASALGAALYTLYFRFFFRKPATDPNRITGEAFEKYCVKVLRKNGFRRIRRTGGSGDHGVDILCRRRLRRIAVQCKCYTGGVGNSAVQQVYTGKELYGADLAAVMTNSYLTAQARQEAAQLGVLLWDRKNFEENHFPLK